MRSYKNRIERIICYDIKTSTVFLLFYILSANYVIYSFLAEDAFKNYFRLAVIPVIAGYCIWRFIHKKLNFRFFAIIGAAFLAILTGGSLSMNVCFLLLLVLFIIDLDASKINNAAFLANIMMLVFILLCLIVGLVDNYHYVNSDGRSRVTFGFTNVNAASAFAFSLATTYLLSRNVPRYKYALNVLLTITIVYLVTDSRTAFLSMIFLLLVWAVFHSLSAKCCRLLVGLFVVAMFISPCIWKIPFVSQGPINNLLSARPILFVKYISQHSFWNFLFGGSCVTAVDNSYLILLYNCGVFLYVACGIVVLIAMDRLVQKNSAMEVGFCLSMLAYGQLEGILLRPEILCVPIFWYYILNNFSLESFMPVIKPIRDVIRGRSSVTNRESGNSN